MSTSAYAEHLRFALELAAVAQAEILPRFRRCAVEHKADGSEVTDADREAERAIRAHVQRHRPGETVVGEELGGELPADGSPCWLIDPIDGTSWFALGLPLFGTLIAYLEDNDPVVGVIHSPALGETVYAARGAGCWFQVRGECAEQVRVASAVPLSEAYASACGPHGSVLRPSDKLPHRLDRVIAQSGRFRFVGDCIQHAMVARGRLHVAIDTVMRPWDIGALVPCVEEAGGVATAIDGQRANLLTAGNLVTSCGPTLHEEVLTALAA